MKCFVCDTELEYQTRVDEHMSIGCPRCGKMWYDESLPVDPKNWNPLKER
jgi:Zn-finger nucleic acid-binding protein